MSENLVKDNRCFSPYNAPSGANAYIGTDDYSANLTTIIDNAEDGITIYDVMGVGMDKGYPINSTAGTNQPWVHVCIIKYVNSGDAIVLVEYEEVVYYARYDGTLGSWHTVTATT